MAAFAGISADATVATAWSPQGDIFASEEEERATLRGFGVFDVFTSLLPDKWVAKSWTPRCDCPTPIGTLELLLTGTTGEKNWTDSFWILWTEGLESSFYFTLLYFIISGFMDTFQIHHRLKWTFYSAFIRDVNRWIRVWHDGLATRLKRLWWFSGFSPALHKSTQSDEAGPCVCLACHTARLPPSIEMVKCVRLTGSKLPLCPPATLGGIKTE